MTVLAFSWTGTEVFLLLAAARAKCVKRCRVNMWPNKPHLYKHYKHSRQPLIQYGMTMLYAFHCCCCKE